MTSWTTPRDWITSEVVTNTLLNTHLRDNLKHLYEITGRITGRRGGSATAWGVVGGTSQIVTACREEVGVVGQTITAGSRSNTVGVTFVTAFPSVPTIQLTVESTGGSANVAAVLVTPTANGFTINLYDNTLPDDVAGGGASINVHWRAIGAVA